MARNLPGGRGPEQNEADVLDFRLLLIDLKKDSLSSLDMDFENTSYSGDHKQQTRLFLFATFVDCLFY